MNRTNKIISFIILLTLAFIAGFLVANRIWIGSVASEDKNIIATDIVSIRETASSSPTVTVEYPQFPSMAAELNEAIASSTLNRLADFRSEAADNMQARKATADPKAVIDASDYSFIASWQQAQINNKFVSIIMRYDSFIGGANENEGVQTFNYDIANHKLMSLQDLFPNDKNYLEKVSVQARQQLSDSLAQASEGNAPNSMIDAGTAPEAANFQNFTFTNYLITIYFPKYAVAPGSFGEEQITLPRGE